MNTRLNTQLTIKLPDLNGERVSKLFYSDFTVLTTARESYTTRCNEAVAFTSIQDRSVEMKLQMLIKVTETDLEKVDTKLLKENKCGLYVNIKSLTGFLAIINKPENAGLINYIDSLYYASYNPQAKLKYAQLPCLRNMHYHGMHGMYVPQFLNNIKNCPLLEVLDMGMVATDDTLIQGIAHFSGVNYKEILKTCISLKLILWNALSYVHTGRGSTDPEVPKTIEANITYLNFLLAIREHLRNDFLSKAILLCGAFGVDVPQFKQMDVSTVFLNYGEWTEEEGETVAEETTTTTTTTTATTTTTEVLANITEEMNGDVVESKEEEINTNTTTTTTTFEVPVNNLEEVNDNNTLENPMPTVPDKTYIAKVKNNSTGYQYCSLSVILPVILSILVMALWMNKESR